MPLNAAWVHRAGIKNEVNTYCQRPPIGHQSERRPAVSEADSFCCLHQWQLLWKSGHIDLYPVGNQRSRRHCAKHFQTSAPKGSSSTSGRGSTGKKTKAWRDEVTCFLCHSGLVAEPGKGALCTGPLCWVSQILSWKILAGSSCCVNNSVRKCDFSEMKTYLRS